LFNAALSRGAEVRLGTTVVAVDPLGAGGGALVADDGERLECDRILIAAGPWTRRLVSSFGVDLPLTVERHVVGTFAWGTAATVPAFADVPGGYYLRPDGDEGFLVGWLLPGSQVEPDAPVVGVAPDELEALAARVVARVPGLAGAVATGGWASLYDVSPDWQPVIGEVAPGIFVDAGTSGHGFKLAPALGAHVADLVLGMPAHPGLASFSPSRFEAGEDLPAGFGEARILG
jgi:glycine/D-amino acid oxidase-like deaminating enzyme